MQVNATFVRAWLALAAEQLQAAKAYLTELDAAIGDADHGINIARGFAAAEQAAASAGDELGALFKQVGMTVMSSVGGASGMLYGNFFLRAAAAAADKSELSANELLHVLQSGRDGIIQRGRAELGDKTMVDVWTPALDAFAASLAAGEEMVASLQVCRAVAFQARDATAPMQAKKGRASYLGPRSCGHIDPGAASSAIILAALTDVAVRPRPLGN